MLLRVTLIFYWSSLFGKYYLLYHLAFPDQNPRSSHNFKIPLTIVGQTTLNLNKIFFIDVHWLSSAVGSKCGQEMYVSQTISSYQRFAREI